MKRFYSKKDKVSHTIGAVSFREEIQLACCPIIKKWIDRGYSVRDAAHLAMSAIFELECLLAIECKMDQLVEPDLLPEHEPAPESN